MTVPFRTVVRGLSELRHLREGLREWLEDHLPGAAIDELLLAVSELATNAVEASPFGKAEVEGEIAPDGIRMLIVNHGAPFEWPAPVSSQRLRERGRGLELAAAFVDELAFTREGDCTYATIRKNR